MFAIDFRPTTSLIAAVTLAAVCAACGSTSDPAQTIKASSTTATVHAADCVAHPPGPTSVDDVFVDVPGFVVEPICPIDVNPTLASAAVTTQFLSETAGKVSEGGTPILSVFAGQLKAGSGEAFTQNFLKDLSSRVAPTKVLAVDPKNVGGHDATYFNVAADVDGFVYANGPTVVIAYDLAGGSKAGTVEDAFAKVLANLH